VLWINCGKQACVYNGTKFVYTTQEDFDVVTVYCELLEYLTKCVLIIVNWNGGMVYEAFDPNFVNIQECAWHPHLSEGQMDSSEQCCSQVPLFSNPSSSGGPPQLPVEYYVQPYQGSATSGVSAPLELLEADNVMSSDSDSDKSGDEDGSDTLGDEDGSDTLGDEDGSLENQPFKLHMVYRSGKLNFVCDETYPNGRLCDKGFLCKAHVRRHIRTVHHRRRLFPCKVPQCEQSFPRSDNLREHYWSHVQRSDRTTRKPKCDRISLQKLSDILGPREKTLKQKLEKRLARWNRTEAKRTKKQDRLRKRLAK
jgi:hypothetical protein